MEAKTKCNAQPLVTVHCLTHVVCNFLLAAFDVRLCEFGMREYMHACILLAVQCSMLAETSRQTNMHNFIIIIFSGRVSSKRNDQFSVPFSPNSQSWMKIVGWIWSSVGNYGTMAVYLCRNAFSWWHRTILHINRKGLILTVLWYNVHNMKRVCSTIWGHHTQSDLRFISITSNSTNIVIARKSKRQFTQNGWEMELRNRWRKNFGKCLKKAAKSCIAKHYFHRIVLPWRGVRPLCTM